MLDGLTMAEWLWIRSFLWDVSNPEKYGDAVPKKVRDRAAELLALLDKRDRS